MYALLPNPPPLAFARREQSLNVCLPAGDTVFQWRLSVSRCNIAVDTWHIEQRLHNLLITIEQPGAGFMQGRLSLGIPHIHINALLHDKPLDDAGHSGLDCGNIQGCRSVSVVASEIEPRVEQHMCNLGVALVHGRVQWAARRVIFVEWLMSKLDLSQGEQSCDCFRMTVLAGFLQRRAACAAVRVGVGFVDGADTLLPASNVECLDLL